ncbi:MAG: trigger factor [Candidatus Marinimicrobia bacterium]|nr:trigger factor [Candidatus Neomarinimicrobiota bacterium]MDD5583130.1 trigger factor [Candidatus Neomarinimicrobiota bacterium]
MKTDVKEISQTKHALVIEVPWEEIEPLYNAFLKKFKSRIQMPGFRKGKVPMGIIERQYGSYAEVEFVEENFNLFYYKGLQEGKLNPVGDPEVENIHFHKGEPLHLHLNVEILPELILPDYKKGFIVEKPVYTIKKEDVENQMNELRKQNAELVEKDGPADMGDYLEVEVVELDVNGNPLPDAKPEVATLVIGENPLTDDRGKALIGIKKGENRQIIFKAENENDEDHSFDIKVLKIQTLNMPELNKEFVQTIEPDLETVDQLKDKIKEEIQSYLDNESKKQLENNIREYFLEALKTYEIPETVVQRYLDELYKDQKEREHVSEEEFRKQYYDIAFNTLKWMMIREEIIRQENLEVSQEDIQKRVEKLLENVDEKLREAYRSYYESEEFKRTLYHEMMSEKVLDHLKTFAKIKEKKVTPKG